MATTFKEQVGDGDATVNFTFPSYQSSDVKVRVDGVLKTAGNHYNIINYTTTGGGDVVFTSGNIPSSPALIRIYRDTNVDTAKATFTLVSRYIRMLAGLDGILPDVKTTLPPPVVV